jgi:hypothetical protein
MTALVASRFNPILSASYQRLRKAGKLPKAALFAVIPAHRYSQRHSAGQQNLGAAGLLAGRRPSGYYLTC